jgi:preprotein translocase subunit SecF
MEFFKIRAHPLHAAREGVQHHLADHLLLASWCSGHQGLHFSIEFTGGTVMEVSYKHDAEPERSARPCNASGSPTSRCTNFGTSRDVLIRLPLKRSRAEPERRDAEAGRRGDEGAQGPGSSAELKRVEFVGGQVGKELATDGGLALLMVCVGIMIYLAFRFEWRFAVATSHREPARRRDHPGLLRASSSGSSRCRCWRRSSRSWATR